ncbi:electron transfer flavoprotein subunit beta/FixA family protein [Paenibacillus filicis]|uniref:Electron transfer flavoprotein subunit beta n=1 Tax=Paenibacillus gyeongsangnamensis TaxID=3388067 RepID=A0ABT4QCV0_9BACL|nr:electron transfer flavoprotein subunit beta/FixA family protein [Paenibacillus filicis]MCZ8514707.1 electron transfer flavoprotein subunit beta/FixA family protein [Paenibacillus filicis]
MNIVVLVKQTFDTEEKIDLRDGIVQEDGVKFILNPYDEYAVEEAIRQKERHGGRITVLSVGPERAGEALRTALAMGADEAVLIGDDRIPVDEYSVSRVLAAYLAKEPPDLLLAGLFSVDNGAGQVAVRTARLLGLPHVSSVVGLKIEGGIAEALRDAEGDSEKLTVRLPALFTAQQGLNEPRYPTLPGIMKAKKKPFARLDLGDLGLSPDDVAAATLRLGLSLPPARQAGRRLEGTPAEQVARLAELLRGEAKAL